MVVLVAVSLAVTSLLSAGRPGAAVSRAWTATHEFVRHRNEMIIGDHLFG